MDAPEDYEIVGDLSWPHGESVVADVRRICDGARFIVKQHLQTAKFVAEVDAYRTIVPALQGHAPALVDVDEPRQIIVMSRLDASHLDADAVLTDPSLHRRAGALLRRYHDSCPPVTLEHHGEALMARFELWLERARPGLLTSSEIDGTHRTVATVRHEPDPVGVPCHRDWQPRNWLIDDAGRLYVIDFEHTRVAPWCEDLIRLWWDEWRGRPALADAFFDGYGRRFDDADRRWFRALSTLAHFATIVWSDEHDDASFGEFGRRSLAAILSDADGSGTADGSP